ncbi:hypothetical protein PISMIDRAFT_25629 [Pisolithus microcarpus 441]|uniref:MaoC-like domain-containing protein n=1 Tax=Pisolithus microcarpus 441 TaxID=765257 RepID=A0A0C9Y793_9AGAM|nr:hypothetical protein PISMIDRAFT_25629 [Pisolithus microcarpus 441]
MLSFKGHTVVVTGAGGGLGKAYSLLFASRGANVIVNDFNAAAAQKVVDEIKQGILRDKGKLASLGNFGQANYSAAKMGLIGFTKSLAREGAKYGIGAVAVAPVAASQMTETIMPPDMLANLKPEFIAPFVAAVCHPDGPNASGRVFEVGAGFVAEVRWERSKGTVWKTDETFTPSASGLSDFQVKLKWSEVTDFSDPRHPESMADAEKTLEVAAKLPPNPQATPPVRFDGKTVIITGAGAGLGRAYALMYGRLGANVVVNDVNEKGASGVCKEVEAAGGKAVPVVCSAEEGERIVKAALDAFGGVHVLVANAGILRDRSFAAMTEQEWDTVIAVHLRGTYKFAASSGISLGWLPNFNPAKLLHGEQYLAIKGSIPTSGNVINETRLLEVLDKGKAASVTSIVHTKDKDTGRVLFENQVTVFIRGAGGFGGKRVGSDRGPATAANVPPTRKPDAVVEEKTLPSQAALYRLSGDYNPLHIDPDFAAMGGFDKPILHGLCFMGFAGKHVLQTFGPFNDIKVRFAGVVFPGETLVTEMWKEGSKVIFVTKVKERGTVVLAAAAATLVNEDAKARL